MSQKKLLLLGYPASTVDYENFEQLQELVLFLEHQHIRLYKIEDRDGLQSSDVEVWNKSYSKYLTDLKCPLSYDRVHEVVDWLLTRAIDSCYQQTAEGKNLTADNYIQRKAEKEKQQKASDPLSAIDFSTEEARKGIEDLRITLGITAHPDPLVVLRACCKFITDNLSDEAIQVANKETRNQKKIMPLSRFDMGMISSKNGTIDAAIRALRLIHLENLREVQTEINEAIVAVQELTADPKTDKKLGKVGL
ncbi:Protein C14orf166 homolog, putative [Brugia malayi]|uniref:Bm3098 n=1 Tax=Brugia malayi TaxID=6279 RepID=A0A0K0J8U2_BRUMA|nr:Protein C14orf166 homolog, putative [Brugia malayi]CRZ26111.1 Bm3098 [Brugia malayi]VIO93221.1 Protein C14orf166 homolog, putative [Brugia malayi]